MVISVSGGVLSFQIFYAPPLISGPSMETPSQNFDQLRKFLPVFWTVQEAGFFDLFREKLKNLEKSKTFGGTQK